MNKYQKKIYLIIFSSLLVICILSGFSLINNENKSVVKFELINEKLIENYSRTNEKGTGTLYEIDVLFTGEVTEKCLNEYVQNIIAPKGTTEINIKFYNSYKDNAIDLNYSSLKYEIQRVL